MIYRIDAIHVLDDPCVHVHLAELAQVLVQELLWRCLDLAQQGQWKILPTLTNAAAESDTSWMATVCAIFCNLGKEIGKRVTNAFCKVRVVVSLRKAGAITSSMVWGAPSSRKQRRRACKTIMLCTACPAPPCLLIVISVSSNDSVREACEHALRPSTARV